MPTRKSTRPTKAETSVAPMLAEIACGSLIPELELASVPNACIMPTTVPNKPIGSEMVSSAPTMIPAIDQLRFAFMLQATRGEFALRFRIAAFFDLFENFHRAEHHECGAQKPEQQTREGSDDLADGQDGQ